MKHLFIVNPVAGGSDKTREIAAQVGAYFTRHPGDYEVYTTRAPMDACRKIQMEADLCSELRVYACGGDGTLNECTCGAAERPNVALTCYPTGTGNDFIRTFGADRERFSRLEELIEGEVHPIDVLLCNERYCLNISSVGIDARIAADVHKYSRLPLIGGATGYVTSAAVNLFKGVHEPMRVTVDGKLYYGDINLVCACNGQYYGGGFHPVPEAVPDDGWMDILIVKGINRAGFARLIGTYAKGQYAKVPRYITHLRTRSMEVVCDKETVVNVDGEAMHTDRLTVTLLPGALRFLHPSNTALFASGKEKT